MIVDMTSRRKSKAARVRHFTALSAAIALLSLAACVQEDGGVAAPEILRFEASPLSTPEGAPTTFLWQIGDSASAACTLDVDGDGAADYTPDCSLGRQEHIFSEVGSFTATLGVSAGGESSSKSVKLDVLGADEPGDSVSQFAWRLSAPQPFKVAEAQGVAIGGNLYSFGGFDSTKGCCTPTARAYVFDPNSETWSDLAPMPPMNGTEYGGVTHAGVATDGKDIFLAGGYTSSLSGRAQIFGTREVLRYTVASDRYSRLPELPVERAAGQLEYYNGKLYYFGGTNRARTQDTGDLYILDIAGGATSWQEGAPLPNPRNHLGSVVLNGKIYAVAGQHEHDGQLTTQNDVHSYDPTTNTWTEVASLPRALSHISDSTFVMGGRIIVVGGEYDHLKAVDNVFSYDPVADSWTPLTPLPIARMSTVADYISGEVIVAGGSGGGRGADTFVGTPLE